MTTTSQPTYPTTTTLGGQNQVIGVVVGSIDAQGNFLAASAGAGLPVAGGGGGGGGGAVTVADGADVTQGAIGDAAVAAGAAGTVNAHTRAISRDIGTVATNLPAKGQAVSAASLPVVISSDQNPLTVTGSVSTTAIADTTASGNITAANANLTSGVPTANSFVGITGLNGAGSCEFTVTGTFVAGLVFQVSPDNGTTWYNEAFHAIPGVGAIATTLSQSTVGAYLANIAGASQVRITCSSYTSGTVAVTIRASTASVGGLGFRQATSLDLIAGINPLTAQPNGASGLALTMNVSGSIAVTDMSSVSVAAASGSGTTITDVTGTGGVIAYDINLSAFTAGASTGLDLFLQYSYDLGTTWYDIWQCEALTAAGHTSVPPIYFPGSRRRFRWVNRGGAATTATLTAIANKQSIAVSAVQRQWFDRTAGVLAGTAATQTAAYDIGGCKIVTASVTLGAATTPAQYQLQTSADGTNWTSVGTAAPAVANTTTDYTILNSTKRFARLAVTTAGTAQTGTVVALTGSN